MYLSQIGEIPFFQLLGNMYFKTLHLNLYSSFLCCIFCLINHLQLISHSWKQILVFFNWQTQHNFLAVIWKPPHLISRFLTDIYNTKNCTNSDIILPQKMQHKNELYKFKCSVLKYMLPSKKLCWVCQLKKTNICFHEWLINCKWLIRQHWPN
jgi:hypothetical protein